MKKLCLIFAVITMLVAAGCEKNISNQQIKQASPPSAYSVNLDVTFKETEMKAKLIKHSSQKHEIQILSPEIMTPLSLVYENGICTVTYDGLTFETDLKRFPQAEFGALLTHALNDIDSGITTKSSTDKNTVIYKGITDYGDFSLIQDTETGLWKEFTVNGIPLRVIFSDYKTN